VSYRSLPQCHSGYHTQSEMLAEGHSDWLLVPPQHPSWVAKPAQLGVRRATQPECCGRWLHVSASGSSAGHDNHLQAVIACI
jgi:hypothetical protein